MKGRLPPGSGGHQRVTCVWAAIMHILLAAMLLNRLPDLHKPLRIMLHITTFCMWQLASQC